MNPATAIPFPVAARGLATLPPRRRFRWRYLLLAAAGLFAVLLVSLVLSFRLGGEVRSLRNVALAASPDTWERKVEIGVGRLPTLLAKAGLSFAPLPPEARVGLEAFKSGDVAVYHRRLGSPPPDPQSVYSGVRDEMMRRGWTPIALVLDGKDLVGVFAPPHPASTSQLRACVLVMNKSDLVVASARVDTAPLLELALARTDGLPSLSSLTHGHRR